MFIYFSLTLSVANQCINTVWLSLSYELSIHSHSSSLFLCTSQQVSATTMLLFRI
uniref:FERM domain-containing protein n=1 Tax=Solanum lycopersicum TaxID=4081 RepID=A0A3Q7H8R1_SOLLC